MFNLYQTAFRIQVRKREIVWVIYIMERAFLVLVNIGLAMGGQTPYLDMDRSWDSRKTVV